MKAVCWAVPLAGLLCLGGVSRVEGQPQAAATAPSEDLETNLVALTRLFLVVPHDIR